MSLRAQNVRENEANRSNRKWGCKHIQANEVNILMKSGKISLSSISILMFRSMVICPTKVPFNADMISVQPQMSQSLDNHPPPPAKCWSAKWVLKLHWVSVASGQTRRKLNTKFGFIAKHSGLLVENASQRLLYIWSFQDTTVFDIDSWVYSWLWTTSEAPVSQYCF